MRMARPAEKHYRGNSVKAGSAVFKVGFWVFGVLLQSVVVFLFHFLFSCPCVCTSVEELLGPGLPGLCVSNPKPKPGKPKPHHHLLSLIISPTRSCCSVPPPRQTLPTDTTQPTLPPIGLRQNRQTL